MNVLAERCSQSSHIACDVSLTIVRRRCERIGQFASHRERGTRDSLRCLLKQRIAGSEVCLRGELNDDAATAIDEEGEQPLGSRSSLNGGG